MTKGLLSELPPLSKLLFTLFIIVVSFLLFALIGAVVAIPLFGVSFFSNPDILNFNLYPEYLHIVKFFQILQSFSIFLIPPIMVAFLYSTKPYEYLRIKQQPAIYSLIISGIIMIAALPLIDWMLRINEMLHFPETLQSIEQWMKNAEEDRKDITEAFLNVASWKGYAINVFMFGILAAVGEELLFRGIIQRLFGEWFRNQHVAVILTAFLFSALHMQFYGFLPRFMLGIYLGYLFIWTGSLWIPIFAHFVNNVSAVTVYFLVKRGIINIDPEEFGSTNSTFFFWGSILLVFGLITTIYLKEKSRKTDTTVIK